MQHPGSGKCLHTWTQFHSTDGRAMEPLYPDRRTAGRTLAERVREHVTEDEDVVVLGLPRGGVPVAFEVARALSAPLDVYVVRKLGVPGNEELAMGAVASGDVQVLNEEVLERHRVGTYELEASVTAETDELHRREDLYRRDREPLEVRGRTVVLVDDGVATGASMRAALEAVNRLHPGRTVVAAPTGSVQACWMLARLADEVVCAATPEPFRAVGHSYETFEQTSDDEVADLLALSTRGEG